MTTRPGATPYLGPGDPALRREWRSARHLVARRHHPDVGGNGHTLQHELGRVDRYFASRDRAPSAFDVGGDPGRLGTTPPRWQPAARLIKRSTRRLRRGTRALRTRLPRGFPGSVRYFDL